MASPGRRVRRSVRRPGSSEAGDAASPRPTRGRRRYLMPLLAVALAVAAVTVVLLARGGGTRHEARVHQVPAAIASDCSRPVDQDIARFLSGVPDGTTVRFAKGGCYAES